MNEAPRSGLERAVRKALWFIIGLFVFLFFIPFVGLTLFDAFARPAPFPARELLPCGALIFGPFLLWIGLAAMYFRAPRELRHIYFGEMGRAGRYDAAGIFQFFSGYHKRFGIDIWSWLVLISIPWTIVVIFVLGSLHRSPAH